MADNQIATAYVKLSVSAKGISDDISQELGGSGGKEGSNFGTAFLKGAGAVIATGATAIAGSVTALWNSATAVASKGDEIAKESTKLGVAVDEYQALAFASEHCDFSMSNLLTAQRQLMQSGFEGSIYDAVNSVMALDDATERTALANKLFGERSAQAMANLINGTESLDMFKAELQGLGGMLSEDSVQASATFEDSLTNIQTAVQGMGTTLMAEMLPSLTQTMDGITALFKGNSNADAMISEGIDAIVESFSNIIPKLTNLIGKLAPKLVSAGGQLLLNLADGILTSLPTVLPTLMQVVMQLGEMLLGMLPTILTTGLTLITQLIEGITSAVPTLLPLIISTVIAMIEALLKEAPTLVDALLTLVTTVADSLFSDVLPMLLTALPDIIDGICAFLVSASSSIFDAVIMIVEAVLSNLDEIIDLLVKIVPTILVALGLNLIENVNLLITALIQIVFAIVENIPTIIGALIRAVPDMVVSIVDAFEREVPKFVEIGWQIVEGLWKGLQDKWEGLKKNCKDMADKLVDQFKEFWGIHSPSKVMASLGGFLGEGLAIGIEDSASVVDQAMGSLTDDMSASVSADVSAVASSGYRLGELSASSEASVMGLLAQYLPIIASKELSVELNADANKMFEVMRKQNGVYKKANGRSAFA